MNEFLPRTGPAAPVASAKERNAAVVRPVTAARSARNGTDSGAATESRLSDRSAAAADYARIQAEIADVVARVQPSAGGSREEGGAQAVGDADRAIMALMPSPVLMLPLPPTDADMVAFVAQVAQSIARQAAQTRAAHAVATPIMAEAAAH
jgi:hypothetical protein